MAGSETHVPNLVRDALRRDGAYDFGLGVVLRAPTDTEGAGGSASYRIDYRIEPLLPGRPAPPRRQGYRRELGLAYDDAREKFEEMRLRAGGNYIEYQSDVLFGEVVKRWFDSPHPRWGEHYPDKVRSLVRCWIVADRIVVYPGGSGAARPLAAVAIGALTGDHYIQALEHVRAARAYGTYTEVHGLIMQILKWALTNRYLRPSDRRLLDQLPLAPHHARARAVGVAQGVPPEEIPPLDRVQALTDTADLLFGEDVVTLIHLLAFAGLRISECLALRNDDRFQLSPEGCWRIEVREQVHKSRRKTLPPKWRRHRWAWVPHWLTDDVQALLDATPAGRPLFPSPGRPVRNAEGIIERVGVGLYPYSNWHERVWTKIAVATPDWPERSDWWPADRGDPPPGMQTQRRWLWTVHTLRHLAATYQLNTLGLDPDDVAKFLGHRSGVQIWEMYVRVRPGLFDRAAVASHAAGDPRAQMSS